MCVYETEGTCTRVQVQGWLTDVFLIILGQQWSAGAQRHMIHKLLDT